MRYRGRHRKPPKHRAVQASAVIAAGASLAVTGHGVAVAGPDWGPIIACESSGNFRADRLAVDGASTASGGFQFLDTTWQGLGFTGRAKDASVAAQYEAANRQYAISGFTAWETSKPCWSKAAETLAARPAPVLAPPVVTQPVHNPVHGSYVVRAGDTLTSIAAAAHKPSWRAVYLANLHHITDPNLIFAGQVLAV